MEAQSENCGAAFVYHQRSLLYAREDCSIGDSYLLCTAEYRSAACYRQSIFIIIILLKKTAVSACAMFAALLMFWHSNNGAPLVLIAHVNKLFISPLKNNNIALAWLRRPYLRLERARWLPLVSKGATLHRTPFAAISAVA